MPKHTRNKLAKSPNLLAGSCMSAGPARDALVSNCGQFRYWLSRQWRRGAPRLGVVGCNPSVADGSTDDNTVDKITALANRWGYGSFILCNLFAYVSTDPHGLDTCDDPVGRHNDWWLVVKLANCAAIWVAWGNLGRRHNRDKHVLHMLAEHKATKHIPIRCTGINKDGSPVHPLYQPGTAKLLPYQVYK